jgi:hypothetical protein
VVDVVVVVVTVVVTVVVVDPTALMVTDGAAPLAAVPIEPLTTEEAR